jgi:hypothetical protein
MSRENNGMSTFRENGACPLKEKYDTLPFLREKKDTFAL